MAIALKFDSNHHVESPTLLLATRARKILGALPAYEVELVDPLNSASDLSFKVSKYYDGTKCAIWHKLKDFKLAYCPDWDVWFELYVEIDEGNELVKCVTAKTLGEAELSQINVYDLEINTEEDIEQHSSRSVLYNEENPRESILHRVLDKAPHYKIGHVDPSIRNEKPSFSFDGTSIYDVFQAIAEEIKCLFAIDSGTGKDGKISRTVNVYDLESYCQDCGTRDEFIDQCPSCGSNRITHGYGNDTSIFICVENLADSINYTTDHGSVKNCFKLAAGDDLMTSTIRSCNPNGSGYIWYISDEVKEDMSDALKDKLNQYEDQYAGLCDYEHHWRVQ